MKSFFKGVKLRKWGILQTKNYRDVQILCKHVICQYNDDNTHGFTVMGLIRNEDICYLTYWNLKGENIEDERQDLRRIK